METILQQLYRGGLFPAEWFFPNQAEYRKLTREYGQHYQEFISVLKELDTPLDKQFSQVMDEWLETTAFEFTETFRGGFCMGAKLMLEIMLGTPGMDVE